MKKNLGDENFAKLQKLGKVSEAFVSRSKNILNPSGTATTIASPIALAYGLYNSPIKTIGTIGFASMYTKLLTNGKWLDAAIKLAENPSLANKAIFNKLTEQITGHSAIALSKKFQENNPE